MKPSVSIHGERWRDVPEHLRFAEEEDQCRLELARSSIGALGIRDAELVWNGGPAWSLILLNEDGEQNGVVGFDLVSDIGEQA